MNKKKNKRSVHMEFTEDVFEKIDMWNEIYGLNTTAFVRLAVKEKLRKEGL